METITIFIEGIAILIERYRVWNFLIHGKMVLSEDTKLILK